MKIELKELIEKLEFEFEDVPKGSIKASTNFKEIENWGSMHVLILIALADVEFGVQLSGADLKGLETVQDFLDLINSKK